MVRHSRIGKASSGRLAQSRDTGGSPMTITATHNLLTNSWTADVAKMETAIGRFKPGRSLMNNCQVVFFEMVRDGDLHVNVTHRHPTVAVRGWAGPGEVPDGFIHNRTFSDAGSGQMLQHIRDMVLAARI